MRVCNHFLFTETHAVGLCPVNGHVRNEKKCIFNFFNLIHFSKVCPKAVVQYWWSLRSHIFFLIIKLQPLAHFLSCLVNK